MPLRVNPHGFFFSSAPTSSHLLLFSPFIPRFLPSLMRAMPRFAQFLLFGQRLALQQPRCASRGPATLAACAWRGIEPYIATGRDPHHPSWQQRFAPLPDPPPEDASSQVKMAYKLKTAVGKAIYWARKCTIEPVIGIIKEALGFRQLSLRR